MEAGERATDTAFQLQVRPRIVLLVFFSTPSMAKSILTAPPALGRRCSSREPLPPGPPSLLPPHKVVAALPASRRRRTAAPPAALLHAMLLLGSAASSATDPACEEEGESRPLPRLVH